MATETLFVLEAAAAGENVFSVVNCSTVRKIWRGTEPCGRDDSLGLPKGGIPGILQGPGVMGPPSQVQHLSRWKETSTCVSYAEGCCVVKYRLQDLE